ncbi:MAG: hypothetical protein AABZ61_05470, partial [Bacteroidota bacterium]
MKEPKNSIETRDFRVELDQGTRQWSLFEKADDDWTPVIQSAYSQLSLEDGRAFRVDDRTATLKVTKKRTSDFIGK